MSATKITVGAVSPEAVVANITDDRARLASVSAVSLKVRKADGSTAVWTGCEITNQTATTLTATYLLQVGDLSVAGRYQALALMTVPGGTIKSLRGEFTVDPEFN